MEKVVIENYDQCLKCLEELETKLSNLLKAVSRVIDGQHEDMKTVQKSLRELKKHINSEVREVKRAPNPIEDAFYLPALIEAGSKLEVRCNSLVSEEWERNVFDAYGSVSFYLENFRGCLVR